MLKLVNNLNEGGHLKTIKELSYEAEEIIFVSPFIYDDFRGFFEGLEFKSLKSIQLITTLQAKGDDQLKKPDALFSFIEWLKHSAPSAMCLIHFNNKLHGKIYLFEYKSGRSKALISSANLTHSGFNKNHEWGVLTDDQLLIKQLKQEIIDTIEYADVSHELISGKMREDAESARQKFKESIREFNIDASLINHLQPFTVPKNKIIPLSINDTTKIFLKPYGFKQQPIRLKDKKPFGNLTELHFPKPKQKPRTIKQGAVFITFGTRCHSILCIHTALTDIQQEPENRQLENKIAKRWPWFVKACNHTQRFSNRWWEYDITIDQLREEYLAENPNGTIYENGGNIINYRAGYSQITANFAKFVFDKILPIEEELTDIEM